uniref:Uncharacterized protein n=1 Tax=Strongyloides papillosus TaxID=174720 RepID=A0A0N5CFJ8_STREA
MILNFKIILLLLSIFVQNSIEGRNIRKNQAVGVHGLILCHGVPYRNAKLRLTNSNRINRSRVIASVFPKKNGQFVVIGHAKNSCLIRELINFLNLYINVRCLFGNSSQML